MNYELLKKLKDAGFPLKVIKGDFDVKECACPFQLVKIDNVQYLAPSLSELIDACDGKEIIIWEQGGWYATKYEEVDYVNENCIDSTFHYAQTGSTPEEAVANLWLKLDK